MPDGEESLVNPPLGSLRKVYVSAQVGQKEGDMVDEGKSAPDFELPTDAGKPLKLSKLKGHAVVVYFYPKDDTSGCTKEAQAFTELLPLFKAAKVEIVGISPDSVESHAKFRKKSKMLLSRADVFDFHQALAPFRPAKNSI